MYSLRTRDFGAEHCQPAPLYASIVEAVFFAFFIQNLCFKALRGFVADKNFRSGKLKKPVRLTPYGLLKQCRREFLGEKQHIP